ncbi:MAG TPA: M14 family zinc carboxypeptidase [Pirellulales bacterium]|nr:M14 family zinc carboxypeptidase [Pirellulales bacterium]
MKRFCQLCVCMMLSALGWPWHAAAQTPALSQSDDAAEWNVLGRSLEQRVIEYRQFGDGKRQVLVVGPLEGDSTAALELIESLAEHLQRFPARTSGVRVTLLRDPNPDGRLRRTAGNARGVRLDRNFPTRDWRKIPSGSFWLSGREPESEPETRALVELVDDVRPDQVVILGATPRGADLAYAGAAEELAREFAKSSGLRPHAVNVTAEQGSLAVYTGADRNVPTLLVRIPGNVQPDALWATYKRSLLAAIVGGTSEVDNDAEPSNQVMAGLPTAPLSSHALGGQPPRVMAGIPNHVMAGRPKKVVAGLPKQVMAGLPTAPSSSTTRGMIVSDGRTAVSPPGPLAVPRILTADELQLGGELVPVAPVRQAAGAAKIVAPAVPPAVSSSRGSKPSFGATIRNPRAGSVTTGAQSASSAAASQVNTGRSFPPAMLARPSAKAPTLPRASAVERVPAVDKNSPPPPPPPRPIPLYPETGY